MLYPVRCFNCGYVLGDKGEPYEEYIKAGKTTKEALDLLGIKKMCCRTVMLGVVNMMPGLLAYVDDPTPQAATVVKRSPAAKLPPLQPSSKTLETAMESLTVLTPDADA